MRPDDRPAAAGVRHLVAGFDGSECSRHAAGWAATEAERWGAGLLLVYSAEPTDHSSEARDRTVLDDAVAGLAELHPSVAITAVVAEPPAAAALLHSAGDALLTVVGSWGAGRTNGVPLGSVAFSVASTSRTPVAVVRPEHAAPARRPVAVAMDSVAMEGGAMDGATAPEAALDFAFAAAERRNVRLLVLHVRHDAAIDGAFPFQVVRDPVLPPGLESAVDGAHSAEQRAVLAQRLVPWQTRYPGVHVTPMILFGSPTATLLDFSRRTDLLVIGDAGRGVNSGVFLGPTGQALLHRSACPVVVARGHHRGS